MSSFPHAPQLTIYQGTEYFTWALTALQPFPSQLLTGTKWRQGCQSRCGGRQSCCSSLPSVNKSFLSSHQSYPFSGTASTASALSLWPGLEFFSARCSTGSLPGVCMHAQCTQNKLVRQDFPSQSPCWFFPWKLCLSMWLAISSFNKDSTILPEMNDILSGLQFLNPLWSPLWRWKLQWQSFRPLAQWLLLMIGYTFCPQVCNFTFELLHSTWVNGC